MRLLAAGRTAHAAPCRLRARALGTTALHISVAVRLRCGASVARDELTTTRDSARFGVTQRNPARGCARLRAAVRGCARLRAAARGAARRSEAQPRRSSASQRACRRLTVYFHFAFFGAVHTYC